jgi:acetyl esterase/lipase
MKKLFVLGVLLISCILPVVAQHFEINKETIIYKEIDGHELEMVIYKPELKSNLSLPAIVFFFGGGWVQGTTEHFKQQAEYFASRGMIAICPEYRIRSKHGTTPFESMKDAKSAMRYIKIHADELGVDTNRIVASGGSAGGHLAACTAIIDEINESTDDLSVSTVPMALILFNPVVDTGKRGYGQEKVEGREFEISPVHHISKNVPPTLIMHGKSDTTVPYENVVRFEHAMHQHGNVCKLIGYRKQVHGFFNYDRNPKFFKKTLQKTESFLEDRNLLLGNSWVKKYFRELKQSTTE